jgi:phosphocarrier protein
VIVKALQGSQSEVMLTYKKESVDARSIMSILMLAVRKNSIVTLCAEGEDADLVMTRLEQAFETGFGELSS